MPNQSSDKNHSAQKIDESSSSSSSEDHFKFPLPEKKYPQTEARASLGSNSQLNKREVSSVYDSTVAKHPRSDSSTSSLSGGATRFRY